MRIGDACEEFADYLQIAAAVGAFSPLSASAAEQPSLSLQELVLTAHRSIDQHAIAFLALIIGVVLFAVVTAIMLVRSRARAARLEAWSRDEIARLRDEVDRANALMLSEPQVVVDWPAGSDEPSIDGDPAPRRVRGPSRARVRQLARCRQSKRHGTRRRSVAGARRSLRHDADDVAGQPIEAHGRAIGGRAVLRLKDASGIKRELVEFVGRYEQLATEVAPLRALIEALPSPVWTRDATGQLIFVNAAYARAVEAKNAVDAVDRRLELLDSAARKDIAQARTNDGKYAGRLRASSPARGEPSTCWTLVPRPAAPASAPTPRKLETMRGALVHLADAHRRTLDQLSTGVAMFDDKHRLTFYNAAYRALWDLDAGFLDQEPTDLAVIEILRVARKLPEEQDFRQWKAQLHEAYRAVDAKEHTWHLPGGRTLRVVTTPNPDGGVTYLFHDVTERLDLERRFEELIRVQGETLDNLAEGVAVFGSDGRLRLHNAAFARMWRLTPQALADRPHIEKITALCQPLHGDAPAWQALRDVVTAIDSRETVPGRLERRDGSVVDCTTVPLPDAATLVTFHDVTDSVNVERALRERNEALEDADKIKIDFVHHVSYELRSPLTNIIGFVHLLSDPTTGPLADKQREYLDYITVSTNTLLALINNILDLATIDAGRMQLNLGPVDIRETMAAAAEGVQDRLVSHRSRARYWRARRYRQLHRGQVAGSANPVQSSGQRDQFFPLRAPLSLLRRTARRQRGFLGHRPWAWNSARCARQGVRLVRNAFARLGASRSGDRTFAGPLLRRTARRHGHDRLGGRTGHHRDMHIPAGRSRRPDRGRVACSGKSNPVFGTDHAQTNNLRGLPCF